MPTSTPQPGLTRASLADASRRLARDDRDLGRILRLHGLPPLWARRPGFATLVQIILEQQVSLSSARSMFQRLERRAGAVTPERMRAIGTTRLRAVGLTRQKTRYILELSRAIDTGGLDLRRVGRLDDDGVRSTLTPVPGIGPWTTDVYLLMALRRPDVWPVSDLALAKAMHRLKRLPARPSNDEQLATAEDWRPYRSVAARMLWHYYLSGYG